MNLNVDVCCHDSPGGPSVWIHRLAPELRTLGCNVRIKLLAWNNPARGSAFQSLVRDGFPVSATIQQDTKYNVTWLLNQMRADPPDVFVPNQDISSYYAARYARRSGIPTVGILRSDDSFHRAISDQFVFGRRDETLSAVVCVSDYLRQQISGRKPPGVKVRKIPSGTPVPPSPVTPPMDVLRIAYVGRLVEEAKKVSEVSRAFIRATTEINGVEAVMIGGGPARESIDKILSTARANSVRLAGHIESDLVQEHLQQCHVIVLLSDYEGLPMALMEGMACGCVPVCLRIRSGIPELVDNDVTGLLVNDRGGSFVNAIRRLRNEPGLWQRLSTNARSKIESGYSIQTCAKKWAELFCELSANSGPKRPIEIPRQIKLPQPHPGFAHQDQRASNPSLPVRLYRRTRIAAGRLRRVAMGQLFHKRLTTGNGGRDSYRQ